jgi:hypothetical protein
LSTPATAVREDAVIITVAQGFTTASCPKPILQGIRCVLQVRMFREDGNGNNTASNNLLRPYRKF